MNLNRSLLLLLLTLASKSHVVKAQLTGHFVQPVPNIVQCFQKLREQSKLHWPLEDKSLCDVSSVFGPAISSCTGFYRFNRSLTIHGKRGDVVKAPYDGKVVKAEICEGDTAFRLVLEHEFLEPCEFHGHSVTKFYTTHDKLESLSVEVGDIIEGGQQIATIGDCVLHCGMSLLLGLRIGASCSLSYAYDYKARNGIFPDCNNKGFDPHANAHLLSPFMDDETHFTLHESQCWGPDDAGVMEVDSLKITTGCAGADINRYEVQCGDKDLHVIDFNYREGFDATSSAALHALPAGDEPYIQAHPYKHDSDKWMQELVIPDSYFHAEGGDDCCTVWVYDTWGNYEEKKVCGTSRTYTSMFAQMRDEVGFAWPAPESHFKSIFSSFGIRSEAMSRSSFHKGVDIQGHEGDPILAVYEGKVVTKKVYAKGGNTIMIEHAFLDNTATKLSTECGDGDAVAAHKFYTQYQHLHNFDNGKGGEIQVGDMVETGDQIGTMGKTGDSITDENLHFELRFGSKCSLKFCTAYLDDYPERADFECCQYGYDPMIHPFLLFPSVEADVWFEERTPVKPSIQQDGRVYLHTRSHQASVNAFKIIHAADTGGIDCSYPDTYTEKKSHLLDYSVKHGFHSWKLEQAEGVPRIEGVPAGNIPESDLEAYAMEWRVDVVTPYGWLDGVAGGDYLIIITTDVWGETQCEKWQLFP